jgi:hypothetical protein
VSTSTTPTTAPPVSPAGNGFLGLAGAAGLAAGALVVASQIVGLTLDPGAADQAAEILAAPATVFLLTKLVGFVLLPLALVGAYLHQAAELGRLGLAGFLLASAVPC